MKSHLTEPGPPPSPRDSFRMLLADELARRCADNPQYSLRAFALSLGIDHATLSQVMRGRRALTERTIRRLAERLGIAPSAVDAFVAGERLRGARDEVQRQEVVRLTRDALAIVHDWYHFALLELVHVDDFRPDLRWIAGVLGISVDDAARAVTRLTHLGLLVMESPGRWVDASGDAAGSLADFSHHAVRRLGAQVRRLSLAALADVPPALREHTLVTLAVSTARLPEVIERIARFRRELLELLGGDGDRDDVCQLEIGFYPVTRIHREELHGTPRAPVPDPVQGS